ncbi:MAG: hypothetical protein ACRDOK_10090 [Streptosporangiaceae bacterium]
MTPALFTSRLTSRAGPRSVRDLDLIGDIERARNQAGLGAGFWAARCTVGLSSVITGTLVAPYLALVVTLIYYRLTSAQVGWSGSPAG